MSSVKPNKSATRRDVLKAAGLGVAAIVSRNAMAATHAPPNGRRPNVVLVITDDQGYGDIGCHGNKVIQTPNLDKFYRQSVRLTDFHVAPTCAPTRAGLMTGRWCNRTGVWHTVMGRSLLCRDEVTVAKALSAAGYKTSIFGKWHLGDNYPSRPQDHGFDYTLIHGGGGVGQTPDYWDNDYFDDTYWRNGKPEKFEGYCTDVWFSEAMKFIERNKDRPFLCYLTTNAPHGPYYVPDKYADMYKGKKNVPHAAFYGMITNIDENFGKLTDQLDRLGLTENTILIFTTDNGTSAGYRDGKGFNAGMKGRKGSEYDGGHRVPCFIRWPAGGIGGGKDVGHVTSNMDIMPTMLDLCGAPAPKDSELPGIGIEGDSLKPLLNNPDAEWKDRTVIVDSQRVEIPEKWRKSAVMTDRWRLVNGKELYDIQADAGQKNDIADKHPDVVGQLRAEYEKWWKSQSWRFDDYCRIVIGSDHQNPSRLTSHDWHQCKQVPWNQQQIRHGLKSNGFWAIEVARDGQYEFELRRWPREVNKPITASIQGGRAIKADKARIKIGDLQQTKSVKDGDVGVTFRANLQAGKTKLQTWFTDGRETLGAYYVYVKRLG